MTDATLLLTLATRANDAAAAWRRVLNSKDCDSTTADAVRRHIADNDIAAARYRIAAEQAAKRPIDLEPFETWAPPMPRANAGDLELRPLD